MLNMVVSWMDGIVFRAYEFVIPVMTAIEHITSSVQNIML